jgi:hypothetical protein
MILQHCLASKFIYFPQGNFLDTGFKQDASPSWHSIEFGLQLIKEGIIMRIGNGKTVNIWRDWLPRDYNLKVSQGKTNTRIRHVNQLLLNDNKEWNEDLVKKVCYSQDADWILKLKLPTNPCEDFIAWHYEQSRVFSVKSAYRLAYNLQHGVRWCAENSENHDNSRNLWKLVWNAKVPKKVKIFWVEGCQGQSSNQKKQAEEDARNRWYLQYLWKRGGRQFSCYC